MNARFLAVGTLACAVALYAWQTVSNVALPWHTATMREFASNDAAVQAIRAQAPENGVYFAPQGVLMATSFTPDLADKTQAMGGMMARQVGIDLVAALLLCVVVAQLPAASARRTGALLGGAALAAGAIAHLSDWNWYGFALGYEVVNTIDLGVNGLVAGLTLGAVRRRTSGGTPDATAIPVVVPGVRALGGLAPLGPRPAARKV